MPAHHTKNNKDIDIDDDDDDDGQTFWCSSLKQPAEQYTFTRVRPCPPRHESHLRRLQQYTHMYGVSFRSSTALSCLLRCHAMLRHATPCRIVSSMKLQREPESEAITHFDPDGTTASHRRSGSFLLSPPVNFLGSITHASTHQTAPNQPN